MLKDFGSSMQNGSNDVDEKSIEAFGSQYHYSVTYSFTCKEEFKHVLWSDADYHNGSGSMTASFDIYTAHVYEGEPGAGDYYAVRMTASLASAGMWKGKGDNTHGGVHVRWCGAYATDFDVVAFLREHNADWYQDLSDRIMFLRRIPLAIHHCRPDHLHRHQQLQPEHESDSRCLKEIRDRWARGHV